MSKAPLGVAEVKFRELPPAQTSGSRIKSVGDANDAREARLQNTRELREDAQRHVTAASLNLIEVGPVHTDTIGDFVLG